MNADYCNLTDRGIMNLKRLKKLKKIGLFPNKMSSSNLIQIIKVLKKVTHYPGIDLRNNLTDNVWASILKFK